MRTLYDDSFASLNIATEQELGRFTVTDQHVALIVMINIDNLSGIGGEYSARLQIDDRLIIPDRKVSVDSGETSVSFQSRDIVLYEGGILKVNIKGLAADTNISGRLLIIDTSPVTVSEISNLINSITPSIINEITDSISNLNVTVKPETKVLGPCQRPKATPITPIKQSLTSIPEFKRC